MSPQEAAFAKRIGATLARARLEVEMTQEQVSESLGVNTESISRWERGYTCAPLYRVFELAALYGVTPETLIAGGAGRSLDPANDISALIGGLSHDDKEFVREWVAAMCIRLKKQAERKG
ncbi:helix-turn-helix domain-containing protein [Paraburkholderia sprentiae WSM5005]|uniref:Helix-turn-helix domain-containing protein n=1 Tax=Paraburkholderia sprentiae WSM5005 TaxID=754502 RepID=A0A1I9YLC8_9BURK|nr:helix-turn-helix transcriptional regulator [Paraburkholderia sprentiae]APA87111.1 helix-turn-helix domain-containing protein [Paraburkholderia sprentiae WSM5005]